MARRKPPKDPMRKVIQYFISADRSIQFVGAPGPIAGGAAGGAGIEIQIVIMDADSTINTFNSEDTVNLAVSGSAQMSKANPQYFIDGVATLRITDAVAETVTLTLSGGTAAGRGLALYSTLQIIFN